MFYADIGLLEGLKSETVKSYAAKESTRVANKDAGPSLLPRFADTYKSNARLWITEENIRAIAPTANNAIVTQLATIGNYIASGFEINKNAPRLAMFISQLAYESDGFTKIHEENGSYSAERLVRVWPSRFDLKAAASYANKPEKILNKAYANRIGNGDEQSGDGWRYRGRGLISIVEKANYEDLSKKIGIDLVKNPDLANDQSSALLIAAAYWYSQGLNDISDGGDIAAVTRKLFHDTIDIERRTKYFEVALAQFRR
ncbi:MAG: glycoside hydrolase family 19 protein [Leptothrix sp. (in: b-proteobacteria)]